MKFDDTQVSISQRFKSNFTDTSVSLYIARPDTMRYCMQRCNCKGGDIDNILEPHKNRRLVGIRFGSLIL